MAPAVAVARGVQRVLAIIEPDERPAERIARENAAMLAEMAALGNTRSAATIVAMRRSSDPNARYNLAQRLRRLRRNKNAHCAFGPRTRE